MKHPATAPFVMAAAALLISANACSSQKLTSLVNPFLGTSTLWKAEDLGFEPDFGPGDPYGEGKRIWGGETFPGPALPNAMVQVVPVTAFGSGSGYQREDDHIWGFAHTNKGHWNLGNVPVMPVSGSIDLKDYASPFSHESEQASPGYYRVFLERYGVDAELTATERCAVHRYSFPEGSGRKVFFNLARANERVRSWDWDAVGDRVLEGSQKSNSGTIYFHAEFSEPFTSIDSIAFRPTWHRPSGDPRHTMREIDYSHFHFPTMPVAVFSEKGSRPVEMKIGFSYVSREGAALNLRTEVGSRSFDRVRKMAVRAWERKLGQIKVSGGSPEQQKMFYSCLYRAMMWPALRSDVDGRFPSPSDGTPTSFRELAEAGAPGTAGLSTRRIHHFYTTPSYWDDYRNKLILLGLLSPEVAADVISSDVLRGEGTGFMPTFFHGDHASAFVAGSYLRGIRDFDAWEAYRLMRNNATIEDRHARPFLLDLDRLGYVPELDLHDLDVATPAHTGVTRTLEYSYDDYAVSLMALEMEDTLTCNRLRERITNYRNVFDPSVGLMRGRTEEGAFVSEFDPCRPFFYFQFREANCWQSSFFAPHDPKGLISLYPSKEAFEAKLDSLFTIPWQGYNHHNMTAFIGNYCHGNQPDHGFPYMYYFIGKQEKCQRILDTLMKDYYGMGEDGLALAGMDDAGEMTSWYVFNAIGLYTFSPADPEYLVTVPLFNRVSFRLGGDGGRFDIVKNTESEKISGLRLGGRSLDGLSVRHDELLKGRKLEID